VTDVDVSRLVKAIHLRGSPAVALTIFQLLKTFFSWAMEPERRIAYGLNANPIGDLKPKVLGLRRRVRKHLPDDHELRAYWKAADETPYPYGPIFKGLPLTGVRKAEFAGMRWSEIDWEGKLWTIPEQRSKSKTEHLVPLSAAMLLLLDEVRRSQPAGHGDCVFSTTNGQIPVNGFSKATAAFRAKATAALSEMRPQAVMRRWVLHDTRRVARTTLSALGVRAEVAETVLGHGKRGIEAVYNQYEYLPETRDALSRLADHLARVAAGAEGQFGPRWSDEDRQSTGGEPHDCWRRPR
jgi:integrase